MVRPIANSNGSPMSLRRGNSLRLPPSSLDGREAEQGTQLRRGGSLRVSRTTDHQNLLNVPYAAGAEAGSPGRPARHSAPAIAAPAPELLARSLLQLGCPVVSMPEPRGGVGSEHLQSSDSDDSSTTHSHHGSTHGQGHHQQGQSQNQIDSFGLPKVHVSGPSNSMDSDSILNGSAGSIGARSAPSTPLQGVVTSHGGQPQSIGEGQLAVAGSNNSQLPPPRSPSHTTLRCSDSHLAKPLSRSTPSMTGGTTQTPATVSRSSPTSTSSARQKKFHRHFAQVAADERVLNYYSCALVGDILLQGHLYITPNYFAFYSNVFGYVTKLLIPTVSVQKISKEKTARIIPNAVAVTTDDERHVFCSLLSRDSTFKLMKQVWDAAIEARPVADILPLPVEGKLLAPVTLLVDDSEVNPEEDDSSMSESGTDLTSRPPTVCTDTDGHSASIPRPILPVTRCRIDQANLAKSVSSTRSNSLSTTFWGGLRSSTVIAILVAILAALYVSAALMMVRIDRLHTAYLNHPLASPERFTQDQLLQYLNSNLDQIVRVRQSLQTLSQQFVTMTSDSETGPVVSGGTVEPEDASS
ncbi:uncharacterized protein LOC107272233 isoform X3 [Cephus cinctus]|uniref:Uncharacterized protein LOC107272233 isoform X3 n=1 Tax=Cephus cinctus TaxID=211228 RepID=A0AAJ7RRY8_CEPCN|nr:uncharacterized protein LOC107272233 isoform X3 [Cephus cinctus]